MRWITASTSLGLKFLYAPRRGVPRPSELLNEALFEVETTEAQREQRQKIFHEVAEAIEARGVGISKIKQIGQRINSRSGVSRPWYKALSEAKNEQEHREIQKAVAEWADGDTISAHIAYRNDVLCAGDKAGSAGTNSVFDQENRRWLEETYGIRFVTLSELAVSL